MTCIVGIVHRDAVYIGGDSAGVAGYDIREYAGTKVFVNGEMAMGFTSSFRMGQLLRYAFQVPPLTSDQDPLHFLAVEFVDAARKLFQDKGFLKKDSGVESGGCFMIGLRGRLYVVESDFQVHAPRCDYAAIGSGESVALGALYATPGGSPRRRIRTALEAAARFNTTVRGPFSIVRV